MWAAKASSAATSATTRGAAWPKLSFVGLRVSGEPWKKCESDSTGMAKHGPFAPPIAPLGLAAV